MASLRESSVDASVPPSPSQLTPRSKVRAMLASLDDSDSESTIAPKSAGLFTTNPNEKQSEKGEINRLSTPAKYSPGREQSDFEDDTHIAKKHQPGLRMEMSEQSSDDDDIIQPKGRMASRMQMVADSSRDSIPATEKTARDRVKKLLRAKDRSPKLNNPTRSDEENESNATPKKTGRLTNRRQRVGGSSPSSRGGVDSPGLFVTPTKGRALSTQSGSESDELPNNLAGNDRFQALVERKRQERLAKEAEAAKQRAERAAALKEQSKEQESLVDDDEIDISDDDAERRLTQQAPPTRKASKKALEEMQREAQRLSRNMQLAHEARTKKKITKESLFAKFNYRPSGISENSTLESVKTASSSQKSRSETGSVDTPPSSPPGYEDLENTTDATSKQQYKKEEKEATASINDESSQDAIIEIPGITHDEVQETEGNRLSKKSCLEYRRVRIPSPKLSDKNPMIGDDSDSELEIVSEKSRSHKGRLDAIFDQVPLQQAKESHSLQALRALAHLESPSRKRKGKQTNALMSATELQVLLQQRAREQATRERDERVQELKSRGIIIQTAEEREKEMAELENLIEKARREGEEIKKKEKAAANKERKADGADQTDDEDWEENEGSEDLSGSDLEDESDDGEQDSVTDGDDSDGNAMSLDEPEDPVATNPMFDEEAEESEHETHTTDQADVSDNGKMEEDEEEEGSGSHPKHIRNSKRNARVIFDDEDEVDTNNQQPTSIVNSPIQVHSESPLPPNSVLRSATKTFIPGVTVAGPAGLGLTQIFAGTMDEANEFIDGSPSVKKSIAQATSAEQDSLSFLKRLRAPELASFNPSMDEDSQDIVIDSQVRHSEVPESQPNGSLSQSVQLQFSQSQIHGFDSLVQDPMASQFSDNLGATQDGGFQQMTPIKGRFAEPPSTVDTVLMEPTKSSIDVAERAVKRKGKLRRRTDVASFSDDEAVVDQGDKDGQEDSEITSGIFDIMRNAARRKVVTDDFDKKTSKAREMVNEQAEESDDEYAGLGGASDDESDPDDEYAKELIDDEAGKDADEAQLAALFANRERASDEKQIEKLYNDITKGMLRRKRGADYDLSDSDDDGEARRRMKRQEFARMRKALLADERIGKIAEDPKKQAFLRAIEDRPSDDEMDFLDDFAGSADGDLQSQSQSTDSEQPGSDTASTGLQKRKYSDGADEPSKRLPPHLRRTNPSKKPANLAEIRQSLSSIIEEPNAPNMAADVVSDSDDDLEVEDAGPQKRSEAKEKENLDPFAARRTRNAIVDRISIKRASSNSSSSSSRLAFAAPSTTPGFKVPALLRRATTNSSIASASSSTSSTAGPGMSGTERMGGSAGTEGIRRGGGKKSGVNFFVRESERKALLAKTEKRREQRMFKGAEVRKKVVGGLLGGGQFE